MLRGRPHGDAAFDAAMALSMSRRDACLGIDALGSLTGTAGEP